MQGRLVAGQVLQQWVSGGKHTNPQSWPPQGEGLSRRFQQDQGACVPHSAFQENATARPREGFRHERLVRGDGRED